MRLYYSAIVTLFILTSCHTPNNIEPTGDRSGINYHNQPKLDKLCDVPPGGEFYAIKAADQSTLLVSSRKDDEEILWYSLDAGVNWGKKISQIPTELKIVGSKYITSLEGISWTVNSYFVTEDGGQTWVEQLKPQLNDSDIRISNVYVRSNMTNRWIVGSTPRPVKEGERDKYMPYIFSPDYKSIYEVAILFSNNSGKSWRKSALPLFPGKVVKVAFVDDSQAVALTDSATVLNTQDGGKTWKMSYFDPKCVNEEFLVDTYESQAVDVSFIDKGYGWMSFDDGRVVFTRNGGEKWCDLFSLEGAGFVGGHSRLYFVRILFFGDDNGLALGSDRQLYISSDSGMRWTKVLDKNTFDSLFLSSTKEVLAINKNGIFRITNLLVNTQ